VAGCSATGTYCQAQADCDDFGAAFPLGLDVVGESDDSISVCVADTDGLISELRANEESQCQDVADKLQIYIACAADTYSKNQDDACEPFKLGNDQPCHDELRDFTEAQQDAGDRCSPDET